MISIVRRTAKVLAPTVVSLGLAAAPAGATTPDIGKIRGWWPMNEGRGQTIYDWSGQGNHGTLGSTPGADANDPSWIKGIFWGSALNFSGDDFVTIPSDGSLAPNQFTVSLWARAPQSPGQFKYLVAKGSNQCVSASWGLWTSSAGGLEFYIYNGQGIVRANSVTPMWDGRWHNISATWDGSNASLFIDGVRQNPPTSSPLPIDYSAPNGTTTFGGYRGSCDLLFTGDIDQVMLFDKVLPIESIWDRWGFILNKPTLG
jgi:hypothetical protein